MSKVDHALALSVIIPCHNGERFIGPLLDQLNAQSLGLSQYEIIVVNDGSMDNTRQIVEQYSNVQHIYQEQQGPGAARNTGMYNARGNVILFIDVDLEISSNLLEQHYLLHKKLPDIAAIGGSVEPSGTPKLFTWQLIDHLSSWFNVHPQMKYDGMPEYLPSLNFSIKRELIIDKLKLKWYDGLKHTGEDVLFCNDITRSGLRLAFHPEASVKHHDRSSLREHYMHMNRWGYHAPFVRRKHPNLKYNFLFPEHSALLIFTIPAIIMGYTFLIWKSWFYVKPLIITLSLPQLLLGRIFYALGVCKATIEN